MTNTGLTTQMRVIGDHEQNVIDQLVRCLAREDGSRGVLCADGHLGYSAPIGGVIAFRENVSPAAVGYDIGCGNLAVRTGIYADDLRRDIPRIMDTIFDEVSFGMGRRDGKNADHPIVDEIRVAAFEPQREFAELAAKQLGTVGAGNHYVDLFEDEDGYVWIGVHFGSRGLGHKTASGFMALAQGRAFTDRPKDGEMEAPPDLLRIDSDAGQAYLEAMALAGRYAAAGREVVVQQVRQILGDGTAPISSLPFDDVVHNHHNFAWQEMHDGEFWYVTRKGATPAFPGQRGFVGASMGECSVILEGVDSQASAASLYSTVHGAGRAMSRNKAAGKQRKRWTCLTRDCEWVQPPRTDKPDACPTCGNASMTKRWIRETEGVIDWQATLAELKGLGIELRGANAEEAPGAYKRLPVVLGHHLDTVRVLHTLLPLGVAMAPGDTPDAYKD